MTSNHLNIGRLFASLLSASLLLAACAPVSRAPASPAAKVVARPCDLYLPRGEVEGETIQCGYVAAPWDRTNPTGATARLAYVILKATGANPQPDAIVHVAGGPGAGSTLREPVLEFSSSASRHRAGGGAPAHRRTHRCLSRLRHRGAG